MTLSIDDFETFYKELWATEKQPISPFPWQCRLAAQVCQGEWPDFIDLPTASGKTACLDVAIFALAVQATLPPEQRNASRRIFFVVNRRVIVDEADRRARKIAQRLLDAKPGTLLYVVAEQLRSIGGDHKAPPLDVSMLRGGVIRDNRWARSLTQPTVVTSTIDQVGSRLLFRGYGVSHEAAPLHAALIAHDSTLLLDEAHISRPFAEMLQAVKRFRGSDWAATPISTPFHFVQMTATPDGTSGQALRLDEQDRQNPVLQRRHGCEKPITLKIASKAKGKKTIAELARSLADEAIAVQDDDHQHVAIVVNRVATAREVRRQLQERLNPKRLEDSPTVELAIGRMRPLDRDSFTARVQARVGLSHDDETDSDSGRPMFVVATQCLEVGADFDFDAMICECASLDALRQRFGRLNRAGRDLNATGAIIIRADQVRTDAQLDVLDKKREGDDPIYGNALGRTWNWLNAVATEGTIDFGVNAMAALTDDTDLAPLLMQPVHAPIMFPAYVDLWAQTHPVPMPDPDVSLFLHGPQRGEPDVNVCWRRDLPEIATEAEREQIWRQVVGLCPPTTVECMPVPIGVLRHWLTDPSFGDTERSDLLDASTVNGDEPNNGELIPALAWRGTEKSLLIRRPSDIQPGDTIVLRDSAGGGNVLGHIPDSSPYDIAEVAWQKARGRTVVRLTAGRLEAWPTSDAHEQLTDWLADNNAALTHAELRNLFTQLADDAPEGESRLAEALRALANPKLGLEYERYPDGCGTVGVVLKTRRQKFDKTWLPAIDDGDDTKSRTSRNKPISLRDHTRHVCEVVKAVLRLIGDVPHREAFEIAANLHDTGKADPRFQALLVNGNLTDAGAQPNLWAKSGRMPDSPIAKQRARQRSGLPAGFRHEMLSVQLAGQVPTVIENEPIARELMLHLIATHHGYGRPFAPVVEDETPPSVKLDLPECQIEISSEQRRQHPPHRLDSGIAERFWRLTREFGWWGLAYLEAILRLADQQASAAEDNV